MRRLCCGLLLAALILTGCSSNDENDPETEEPRATDSPTTVLGAGSDIPNDIQARADVRTTQCKGAGTRRWRVVAKATNSTDQPVHYELALRFASASDGSVLARRALKTRTVEPGEAVRIKSTARLDRKAKKVNCVFVAIDRVEG